MWLVVVGGLELNAVVKEISLRKIYICKVPIIGANKWASIFKIRREKMRLDDANPR